VVVPLGGARGVGGVGGLGGSVVGRLPPSYLSPSLLTICCQLAQGCRRCNCVCHKLL